MGRNAIFIASSLISCTERQKERQNTFSLWYCYDHPLYVPLQNIEDGTRKVFQEFRSSFSTNGCYALTIHQFQFFSSHYEGGLRSSICVPQTRHKSNQITCLLAQKAKRLTAFNTKYFTKIRCASRWNKIKTVENKLPLQNAIPETNGHRIGNIGFPNQDE